jgi:hypothetical protein
VQPLLYERMRLISSGSRAGSGTGTARARAGPARMELRRTLYTDLYETRKCAAESVWRIALPAGGSACVPQDKSRDQRSSTTRPAAVGAEPGAEATIGGTDLELVTRRYCGGASSMSWARRAGTGAGPGVGASKWQTGPL